MNNKIDIRDDHYKIVVDILKKHLAPTDKVFAYGSRVKWTTKNSSDLDLAVITDRTLFNIIEDFEESDLPYKVDIMDYKKLPDNMRDEINKEKVAILFNWQNVKLGEIGTTITGATPSSKIEGCFGEDIPFITPTDFKNYNKNIYTSDRYLSKKGKELLCTRLLPKNSIIVTCIGSQMGKSAISRISCVTNQQINSIIPNEKINCDFLYYVMVSLSQYLSNIARGGTTMPILNKSSFDKLDIPLPPLKEQQRIADTLSAFDDKIEINKRICSGLEDMARLLFRKYFIDNEAKVAWKKVTLGDKMSIRRGASPRPIQEYLAPQGLPWVKISDATSANSPFLFSTNQFIKESGKRYTVELKRGSLILSNSATPGIPKFLEIDACIHDGWLSLSEFKGITQYFLYNVLCSIRVHLCQLGNGSVFTNLTTDIIKNYVINMPPQELLEEFENTVVPMYEKIKILQKENINLRATRDLLLPRLMKGEI